MNWAESLISRLKICVVVYVCWSGAELLNRNNKPNVNYNLQKKSLKTVDKPNRFFYISEYNEIGSWNQIVDWKFGKCKTFVRQENRNSSFGIYW